MRLGRPDTGASERPILPPLYGEGQIAQRSGWGSLAAALGDKGNNALCLNLPTSGDPAHGLTGAVRHGSVAAGEADNGP